MIDKLIEEEIKKLQIDLTTRGISQSEIVNEISDTIKELVQKLGSSFLVSLKENASASIRESFFCNQEFLCRLEFRWYKAFDLLSMIIGCCLEVIEEIDNNNIPESYKYRFSAIKRMMLAQYV